LARIACVNAKKQGGVDSSYLESRLQPDSFFGASGGQNVDTAEAVATGSSMMYSPSQLDAGGDVDPWPKPMFIWLMAATCKRRKSSRKPCASTPKRVAIHAKMLEIYAKRRDVKAFEVLATELYTLSSGTGPEWEHACALGQELDPANPLYQPGGKPLPIEGAPTDFASDMPLGMANTQPFMPLPDEVPPSSPLTAGVPWILTLIFPLPTHRLSNMPEQATGCSQTLRLNSQSTATFRPANQRRPWSRLRHPHLS
jgi:hypothetical protein